MNALEDDVFLKVRCCMEDEGRPLGAGLQGQAPNRLKLHR